MAMPRRNRKGQFVKKGRGGTRRNPSRRKKGGGRKRRRTTRRRTSPTAIIRVAGPRSNPAAATVVNPYGFLQPPTATNPRRRRRRRRNPAGASLPTKLKDLTKGKVLMPLFVGGGIGVASVALIDKYIGPKVPPWALSLIKIVAGVLELPFLNRVVAGSGFYALGYLAGDALATWVTKILPFGDAEYTDDAIDGLGSVEVAGDVDVAGLGEFSDDGNEDVVGDVDGELNVVDGLGVLPPVPIPPGFPRPMLRKLKRGKLMWLMRLGIRPEDLEALLKSPPKMRRAAISKLRQEYDGRRDQHRPAGGGPPPWARRPRLAGKQRRLMRLHRRRGRGRGRGGLRGMDEDINAAMDASVGGVY
jgi:hypothetical protein